jgi:hypothetical protein
MTDILTYSPAEVDVSIAGIIPIEGFSDNTLVEISKDERNFAYRKSMRGNIARLKRKDDTYTIKLHLAQTSTTNNKLSLIHTADISFGIGKFPLFIKDKSGSFLFFATNCWIEEVPSITFTNSIQTRVWSIKASFATQYTGGNSTESIDDIMGYTATLLTAFDKIGIL